MGCLWYCLLSSIVYAVVVLLSDFECLEGTLVDTIGYYLTFGPLLVTESLLSICCGKKVTESLLSWLQASCNSPRNPVGQLVFVSIYGGCALGVVNQIFPELSDLHKAVGSFWFVAVLLLYIIVCKSDPGIVVDSNQVDFIRLFPPDGELRVEKFCDTCMKVRPAQGKHHDGHCIALYDHYCIWVKNSIGFFNMRYFLLFLMVTSLACAHGAVVGTYLVYADMISRGWHVGSYDFQILFRIVANEYGPIGALISFLFICSSVLFTFFLSQIWQILQGMTTYESIKIRSMEPSIRRKYQRGFRPRYLWMVLRPHYHLSQSQKYE